MMISKLKTIYNSLTVSSIKKTLVIGKQTFLGQTAKYPRPVIKLENKFKNFVGTDFSLSFGNGSSGFEAITFAYNIQVGDTVLVSRLTFYSVILRLLRLGVRIKYLEFDDNLQPIYSSNDLMDAKAVIVSHLFGIPQDTSFLEEMKKKGDFLIIEDCSHAHGASIRSKRVGSIGDASFFSLQGTKPISAGEGGIVCTNSSTIYDKMRIHSHMGRNNKKVEAPTELQQFGFGGKSRIHPLGAGLALVDLGTIDKRNKKIESKIIKLNNILEQNPNFKPVEIALGGNFGGGYFGYPVWVRKEYYEKSRAKFREILIDLPYPDYTKNKFFNRESLTLETLDEESQFNENVMFIEERYIGLANYTLKFISFDFINKSKSLKLFSKSHE